MTVRSSSRPILRTHLAMSAALTISGALVLILIMHGSKIETADGVFATLRDLRRGQPRAVCRGVVAMVYTTGVERIGRFILTIAELVPDQPLQPDPHGQSSTRGVPGASGRPSCRASGTGTSLDPRPQRRGDAGAAQPAGRGNRSGSLRFIKQQDILACAGVTTAESMAPVSTRRAGNAGKHHCDKRSAF